ncbi:MAG: rhomboid family intramembrane serine protease [Thaumarchaeota archaeon]|nr:rhomboid family intramembrane serine protease [Nitrososphaerota archaeon]
MLPLYAVDKPGRRAVVTWALIGANTMVFIAELVYTSGLDPCLQAQLFYSWGLVPFSLTNGVQVSLQCSTGQLFVGSHTPLVYLTPFTSMFLHAGYLHLVGNMLFLFVFGGNIEARFGRIKFLASYLACGLAGGLAMILTSSVGGSINAYIPGVGASGAISGVMAAYLVLYPNSRIISIIGYFILPVRAFWFIGGWFLLQVLFQAGGIDTGVAYAAHIGGFMLGLGLAAIVRVTSVAVEPEL